MELTRAIARGLLLSAILLLAPAAALLLGYADTGRAIALGAVSLSFVVAGGLLYARWRRASGVAGLIAMSGLVVLLVQVPGANHEGPVNSSRIPFALSHLVPEVDQVKMGIIASPQLDRFIDAAQAQRIARLMLPPYRGLSTQERRSALSFAYGQLFGSRSDVDHMYWSVPERVSVRKAGQPALVFLHGSGGNFLVYAELLRELDVIVVCPTSGFGLYRDSAETARVVANARRFAIKELGADPDRVYLAALSQGGVGATQVGRLGAGFKGVALISAVVDLGAIADWRGPNVLVLHGAEDRRIPLDYTRAVVAKLSASTSTVTTRLFPEEDHFLLFSKREDVLAALRVWIQGAAR